MVGGKLLHENQRVRENTDTSQVPRGAVEVREQWGGDYLENEGLSIRITECNN